MRVKIRSERQIANMKRNKTREGEIPMIKGRKNAARDAMLREPSKENFKYFFSRLVNLFPLLK